MTETLFLVVSEGGLRYIDMSMEQPQKSAWLDRLAVPLLALGVLCAYVATLTRGAYPGLSASLIVQHAGLVPLGSPLYPVWHWLARLVSALPFGTLAVRMNLFSALCGAVSIGLLYDVVRRFIWLAVKPTSESAAVISSATRLAGLAACLSLAFSIPFWIASNRFYPLTFHVLLLLGAARIFSGYMADPTPRRALLFALFYGLGVAESATFIVFAPVFGIAILLVLWRREDFSVTTVLPFLAAIPAALALYALAGWSFLGSEGYEYREYNGFLEVVWFSWRDQYWEITRTLPRVGWLIILLVTAVPWLTGVCVAVRGLNNEEDWTYYILHFVMTVVTLGVLLNSPLSPWTLVGFHRLLVTPYVMIAALYGYLVAYWYLLPRGWWRGSESPSKQWLRSRLGPVLAVCCLVPCVLAPIRNFHVANGRPAEFVDAFARKMVSMLSTQTWLVTDGNLDAHLHVAAHDSGRALHLLDLSGANNRAYLNMVAKQFSTARLRNLARVGVVALLQDWMASDPEITDLLAVQVAPDFWSGAGLTAIPNRLLFTGAVELSADDLDKLFRDHKQFWDGFAIPPSSEEDGPPLVKPYREYCMRHAGRVANNLGVLMEDHDQADRAFYCYGAARRLDPGNVSALMNQFVMVRNGYETTQSDALREALENLTKDRDKKYRFWALARTYGYVRVPAAFVEMGWTWALSGRPGVAISGLRRALAMSPKAKQGRVRQTLADIYLMQEQDEESEALCYETLVENPQNQHALLVLSRISIRKGDLAKARDFLARAEKAGAARTTLGMEWAALHIAAADLARARVVLEELVELEPGQLRAWAMLASVMLHQKDLAGLPRCLRRITEIEGRRGYLGSILRGQLAVLEKDLETARGHFEDALAARPKSRQALEAVLRIDMVMGRKKDGEEHARRLILLDRDNALGHYAMGSLQLMRGERELAEDSLRRSLAARKSPDVLNDLAWLLQETGAYDEAEGFARAAFTMNDRMFQAVDTLGVILMRKKEYAEAEKTFKEAIAMQPKAIAIHLHLAELYVLQGDRERAQEIVETLRAERQSLSVADQLLLDDLRKKIRQM
jgi:tetratricopeptide (TPR) repeat protein